MKIKLTVLLVMLLGFNLYSQSKNQTIKNSDHSKNVLRSYLNAGVGRVSNYVNVGAGLFFPLAENILIGPRANANFEVDIFKTYTSPLEMYNNSPYSYGGIFLGQLVQDGIYYSVQSPLTQTKNLGGAIGTRTFYFQNWSTTGGASLQQVGSNPPGYDQKAVVFTSAGATVNANLKGQLMSNDQNGVSNPSQRKMVRTDNGQYHVVYESMGTVFYTYSLTSNFYGVWSADEIIL